MDKTLSSLPRKPLFLTFFKYGRMISLMQAASFKMESIS